ncbi:hypothetical protein A6R68_17269 [Neotoma lepida]|uniref:Pre-PUA domain-containing protein n=1 Tax=Neotoma lepida TaxID=56216 RepID=A0A1A6HF61_NEOLE|nr:hypothetical protein A6R68_17269 [Neotoma lepida]
MFKKFDEKENVSNCIQLKTSVIKGIKNQLIEQFPGIEPWLNQIMPKKDPVKIVRCEKVNKGIGIENIHYLNDGLWHMKTYK